MHEDELGELARTIAEFHGFTICEEPWTLYYDETENCRSISYGNNGIKDRRPFKRDFILGGIMTKQVRRRKPSLTGRGRSLHPTEKSSQRAYLAAAKIS